MVIELDFVYVRDEYTFFVAANFSSEHFLPKFPSDKEKTPSDASLVRTYLLVRIFARYLPFAERAGVPLITDQTRWRGERGGKGPSRSATARLNFSKR